MSDELPWAKSPYNLIVVDDAGLMDPEEKQMVQVHIVGGSQWPIDIKLGVYDPKKYAPGQANPSNITGTKEFGVEIIEAVPYTALVQNTVKNAPWQKTFTIDTYKKHLAEQFFKMDAGPYLVTMSLAEIKMYLKKLNYVQHQSREWYYTWTLDFTELKDIPRLFGTPQPEPVDIPALYPEGSSNV